jgi:DNA-binding GntR family transcriptional regulator
MAPEPVVQERIYRALKADLRTGALPPGCRIEIQTLADRYGASPTPVREACWRLVGEALLEMHRHGGFRVVALDAARLRSLYEWTGQLLSGALAVRRSEIPLEGFETLARPGRASMPEALADATGQLFRAIAVASENPEMVTQVDRTNDRLHFVRLSEGLVFRQQWQELEGLLRGVGSTTRAAIRGQIVRYHRRRSDRAGDIISASKSRI